MGRREVWSLLLLLASSAVALQSIGHGTKKGSQIPEARAAIDRKNFIAAVASAVPAVGMGVALGGFPQRAFARGRATLDQAYDRYSPRITAGGEFFKRDLRALVEKSDWNGIKLALAEPPKKTKEDRAKADGGIADRAAQAGGFSDSRVLVACDLYAAAFSDSSISTKTRKMKVHVDEMRTIITEMQQTAKIALGEESAGGGLFGLGAKKPSPGELAKKMRDLYVAGGNAYNKYIFEANAELALDFKKLPYL